MTGEAMHVFIERQSRDRVGAGQEDRGSERYTVEENRGGENNLHRIQTKVSSKSLIKGCCLLFDLHG